MSKSPIKPPATESFGGFDAASWLTAPAAIQAAFWRQMQRIALQGAQDAAQRQADTIRETFAALQEAAAELRGVRDPEALSAAQQKAVTALTNRAMAHVRSALDSATTMNREMFAACLQQLERAAAPANLDAADGLDPGVKRP